MKLRSDVFCFSFAFLRTLFFSPSPFCGKAARKPREVGSLKKAYSLQHVAVEPVFAAAARCLDSIIIASSIHVANQGAKSN